MAQYYTLDEAAKILGTTPDDLKQMAKKGELRPFQDRGTLRFRSQEIDEMARRRGRGSEPDLQLGEATRAGDTPPSKKRSKVDAGVFDFSLTPEDSGQVEIGQELRGGGSASGGPKSKGPGSSKKLGPVSPAPKPGSDSDVRLVADGSDLGFQIASDSDVKMVDDSGPTVLPPVPSSSKSKLNRPKSKVQIDSGARLIDSDSDVKIVPDAGDPHAVNIGGKPPSSATDSDVRLNLDSGSKRKSGLGQKDALLTEEIDLDAELRQAEEAARSKGRAKPRSGEAQLPTSSPFELSVDDLELPAAENKTSSPESSSDFELTPARPESSAELSLEPEDEEVGLGELSGGAGESGINLQDPADSGISLEQTEGSDEIEFELSLDAESTPKPAPAAPDIDSDSEFELTLDDSGGLAPVEEEAAEGEEKDIFETDFEVPALDEESGSQAVALGESDTDLESSDFDLALGDEDIAADEESGSQVVALEDEEETDDAAATVSARRRPAAVDDEDEVDDLLGGGLTAEEEVEEDEDLVTAPAGRTAVETAPAEWGPLPALALIPCVIVLFLLGLLGFELVHGMWGYRQPNKVTGVLIDPIARLFTDDLPPADKPAP